MDIALNLVDQNQNFISVSPSRTRGRGAENFFNGIRNSRLQVRRTRGVHLLDNSSDSAESENERDLRNQVNPFGNYTSICGALGVLGPGRKFLFATTLFLTTLLVITTFTHGLMIKNFGYALPWIGYSLWLSLFYFFLLTATTDPGVIPKSKRNTWSGHAADVHSAFHNIIPDVTIRDFSFHYPRPALADFGYKKRKCIPCGLARPPRTYHCSQCNVCIRHQDFHVPYLGLCIGERNRCSFFFFNSSVILFSVFLIATNSILLKSIHEMDFNNGLSLCLVILGSLMLLTPNFGICIFLTRLYLILLGRTLREEIQIVYGFPFEAPHPMQKSYWRKLIDFFYSQPRMRSFFSKTIPKSDSLFVLLILSLFLARHNRVHPQPVGCPEEGGGIDQVLPPISFRYLQMQQNQQRLKKEDESIAGVHNDSLLNANSAKRKSHHSNPSLNSSGELRILPSTRPRLALHAKPVEIISSNVANYQAMLDLPKATADLQFQQRSRGGTLSVGDLSPSSTNSNVVNEIIYAARANQLLNVLSLVRNRDSRGIVELTRRVDIGNLMGLGRLNSENIRFIVAPSDELPFLGIMGRLASFRPDVAQRRLAGITQMIAAGLMSRSDGVRIRDIFYTPFVPVDQAILNLQQEEQRALARYQPPTVWNSFGSRRIPAATQWRIPAAIRAVAHLHHQRQQRVRRSRLSTSSFNNINNNEVAALLSSRGTSTSNHATRPLTPLSDEDQN